MNQFFIYFIRWQISAWIMLPLMLLLESIFPLWLNLMVGQAFGALIFWEIDKWIFNIHRPDNIEKEINKIV